MVFCLFVCLLLFFVFMVFLDFFFFFFACLFEALKCPFSRFAALLLLHMLL